MIENKRYPLTDAQAGIWFAHQLEPTSPLYNTGEFVEIKDSMNVAVFIEAIKEAVYEADSLHMRFGEDDNGPWQQIEKHKACVQFIDISQMESPKETAIQLMRSDLRERIDLTQDQLFKQMLFKVDSSHYLWYQKIHHIATDAYAFSLLTNRVANLYTDKIEEKNNNRKLFSRFSEVLEEDEAYKESEDITNDQQYWMGKYKNLPEPISLTDKITASSIDVLKEQRILDTQHLQMLKAAAGKMKAGWPDIMFAAMALYIYRMTGSRDITLGIPMMNRLQSASINIPCTKMNILPLYVQIKPETAFIDIVRHVSRELRENSRHQRYRQEQLQRDLRKIGNGKQLFGPQVNVMPFSYNPVFGATKAATFKLSTGPVEDLTLNIYDQGNHNGIAIDLEGNAAKYTREELKLHCDRFLHLLQKLAKMSVDEPIGKISILLPEESEKVLNTWNNHAAPIEKHDPVSLFRHQVLSSPERVAVMCNDTVLSYKQLDEQSNRLAHVLRKRGVGPEKFAAIALERSENLLVSILAIWKTGGAYLPLDPSYPEDRIHYMLADAKPELIITDSPSSGCIPTEFTHLKFNLEDKHVMSEINESSEKNINFFKHQSLLHAAYIIYTSGSTGKPKGVLVSAEGLVHFLQYMKKHFALKESDRLLTLTTISFDISILEMFMPLISGAACVLTRRETVQDPISLNNTIKNKAITIMQATPTHWQMILSHHHSSLQGVKALVGGEALPAYLAKELSAACHSVTNLYGPTETTIWSTIYSVKSDHPVSTIGKPIDHTKVYVLDESLQPVAPGIEGELYIAGKGLARGYHGRMVLTAERFVANPFDKEGSRMYRTGDIVKWNKNGQLKYIKRADDQVKIRGHRIELGEIEKVLCSFSDELKARVIVREDTPGDQRLAAYVVADGIQPKQEKLTEHVKRTLPDYMVPGAFVFLDKFPLTLNGKLDKRKLPRPEVEQMNVDYSSMNEDERILHDMFTELLNIPAIALNQSFFDLGGHSLLASNLIAKIRRTFKKEIPFTTIFKYPTIKELSQQIKAGQAVGHEMISIENKGSVPLSYAQNRLWIIDQMEGPSAAYNIPLVIELNGPLDVKALNEALQEVVDRHDSLRTVFAVENDLPVQKIVPVKKTPVLLQTIKLNKDEIENVLNQAVSEEFKLKAEPPFKAALYEIGEGEYVLLLLLHHIIADGWSLSPLTKDLSEAYKAKIEGDSMMEQPSLDLQYKDYTLWQRKMMEDGTNDKDMAYWKKQLNHLPDEIPLPFDIQRPNKRSYQGKHFPFEIKEHLLTELNSLAKRKNVTLFMVLQAALSSLLFRLGAGTDIPLGTPIAGRNDQKLDSIIGFFVNTLVLRTNVAGNPTFSELLDRVKETNLEAYDHQEIPFEKIVEAVNPERSAARHPLFQIMLILQSTPEPSIDFPKMASKVKLRGTGTAKFDLTFELWERSNKHGGMDGLIEYRTDLFNERIVARLLSLWLAFLEKTVENPDMPIGFIPIASKEEIQAVHKKPRLRNKNKQKKTIVELLEEQVARYPDKAAVSYNDEKLTYEQLNQKANQLARYLIDLGAGPEKFIAIMLPRSIEMMVSILAVIKSGAAYVPIDPDYPAERIGFILSDSEPSLLITDHNGIRQLDEFPDERILDIGGKPARDLLKYTTDNIQDNECEVSVAPGNAAYIIYTSGSTGVPKGVVIPHSNVLRLLSETENWYHFDHHDIWTMFHSYAFDFSVWEIWGALLYGGKLVIVPYTVSRTPVEFLQLIVRERVTVLNQTPSAFYQLINAEKERIELADMLCLKYIIFGGESLELARLKEWYNIHKNTRTKLVNMYGITETTVHVSYLEIQPEIIERKGNSLIGESIPDLQVYILDDYLQPVPIGVTGEMYVAGGGLARGYLNRNVLTASRFVANPFGTPGSRMYKTGDLAKWQEDGTLDYIGRSDHQVKLRGYRIELGEINSILMQHEAVKEAATIVSDQHGDKHLVGFIVASREIKNIELREFMSSFLPNYMIPSAFVQVEAIPLTSHGKLDVKALPSPEYEVNVKGNGPSTPGEEMLCDLYAEILHLEEVGVNDSFFDLGGHSLLAVRLMNRVREVFGKELGIGVLFEAATVSELIKIIDGESHSANSLNTLLPLRKSGTETPLFCVHPAGGLSWCYAGFMSSLGPEYPLYGLQAKGIRKKETKPGSLVEMARDYIDELKSVQPYGPYRLLGWSLGGNVVHAMAVELQEQGEEVEFMVILDSYPSHFIPLSGEEGEQDALIALLTLGGYDPDQLKDEQVTIEGVIELLKDHGSALASLDEKTIINLKDTYKNSIKIMSEYKPKQYNGDMLFFKSTIVPDWFKEADPARWLPFLCGKMKQFDIECRHKDMCQPVPLAQIGKIISQELQKNEKVLVEGIE